MQAGREAGAARERQRRDGGFQAGGHALECVKSGTEALAEDPLAAAGVGAIELPAREPREHALALDGQVANAAHKAGVRPYGHHTAFRAGTAERAAGQSDNVVERVTQHAVAREGCLVRKGERRTATAGLSLDEADSTGHRNGFSIDLRR